MGWITASHASFNWGSGHVWTMGVNKIAQGASVINCFLLRNASSATDVPVRGSCENFNELVIYWPVIPLETALHSITHFLIVSKPKLCSPA
jgi:hypothetical protein